MELGRLESGGKAGQDGSGAVTGQMSDCGGFQNGRKSIDESFMKFSNEEKSERL